MSRLSAHKISRQLLTILCLLTLMLVPARVWASDVKQEDSSEEQKIQLLNSYSAPNIAAPLSCKGKCRDLTNNFLGCTANACYAHSVYGAYGLLPRRTYRLVYSDNDQVCKTVVEALNWAIDQPRKKLEAIWRQTPDKYATTNMLFTSPVFVRWHTFIGDTPEPFRANPYKEMPDIGRWLVAPILNDGVPRLLVSGNQRFLGLWDYSPEEIREKDWSDGKNYDEKRLLDPNDNEISRRDSGIIINPQAKSIDRYDFYPKIPQRLKNNGVWNGLGRMSSEFEFALIAERYFLIGLHSGADAGRVVDLSRSAGDDVCLFQSDLSESLLQQQRPLVR